MEYQEQNVNQELEDLGIEVPEMPDDLEEVVEEEVDESESLSSITGEESEEQPVQEPDEQPETPSASEPGWIKKRVEKAVSKAVAETEARMQALFDQQMAPFREKMMEDEAQSLVSSRKVADIETARELVRLRNGQPVTPPATQEPPKQPRQANGQFAPKEDPGTSARIAMLEHQADRIMASTGVDVTAEFMNNEDIKMKVVSGEMDFYDVADYMKTRKRPPSPMRTPNGASGASPNAIANMTDEQFDRMERNIKERGARYELK